MNTKTLLAALVGAIASFLLGWLVYGMMMMPIYTAHEIQYEGLMKDMEHPAAASMIAIFIGNLSTALLLALIISWSNMAGLMKGAVIGATFGFLTSLNYDMFNIALMNIYKDSMIIVVDIIVSTIFMAIIGGVIGWMMGRGIKPAAATS